jgi:flagellar hook protein FlgE
MSIQGTFNTAVQGLNVQAHALSVISTNIANVQTTAYKTENTHFETLLNHIRPNTQTFLAVKAMDSRNVSAQGQIATTQRTYDLAINGRGFIVTNTAESGPAGIWQYTRDGALFGRATSRTDSGGVTETGTVLTTAGGSYVYGLRANADGSFNESNITLSSLEPIFLSDQDTLTYNPTSNIQLQANLADTARGRQVVTLPFVDEAGISRTLTLGFTATVDATWEMDASASGALSPVSFVQPNDEDADPTNDQSLPPAGAPAWASPRIGFGSTAQLNYPAAGRIVVNLDYGGTAPQRIVVDLSRMTGYAGDGVVTVQNIDHDGYMEGRLERTYFNSEGVLIGSYSNSEIRSLYKLPVATFAVDDKLEARPGNYFLQTAEAGELRLRTLGTQGTSTGGTTFIAGALERSTVDLADQFSRMIITQRAYSSNATVVRTADEMTQAARDMKR